MPEKINEKEMLGKMNQGKKKLPVSNLFVSVLAIVSIVGFISIISKSLFNFDLAVYAEASILIILGIGFIFEAEPIQLFKKIRSEFNNQNFSELTTLVIGILAFISGVLSFSWINIEHFAFLAIKGVISIIAIIFIIIQTWIIKQ